MKKRNKRPESTKMEESPMKGIEGFMSRFTEINHMIIHENKQEKS